jgi:hypothetical protein
MALHGYSLAQDDICDLKPNQDRDLNFAVEILLRCTLEGLSKASAITEIAEALVAAKVANSLHSAITTVKRAWRRYQSACHFVAAEVLLGESELGNIEDQNLFAIMAISLAEELRRSGEIKVPSHGTIPVLNADITWKVPDAFPLVPVNLTGWRDGSGTIEFPTISEGRNSCLRQRDIAAAADHRRQMSQRRVQRDEAQVGPQLPSNDRLRVESSGAGKLAPCRASSVHHQA